jgi:hypothetical protein
MTYRNRSNPQVEVEVISDDAQYRLGETRWQVVVYRRLDDGTFYVRPKAEFDFKFAPIAKN